MTRFTLFIWHKTFQWKNSIINYSFSINKKYICYSQRSQNFYHLPLFYNLCITIKITITIFYYWSIIFQNCVFLAYFAQSTVWSFWGNPEKIGTTCQHEYFHYFAICHYLWLLLDFCHCSCKWLKLNFQTSWSSSHTHETFLEQKHLIHTRNNKIILIECIKFLRLKKQP